MKPHLRKYIVLLGIVAAASFIGLLPPFLLRVAIDNYIVPGDRHGILLVLYAVLLLGAVEGLIRFATIYLRDYLGHKIVLDLRARVYSHLNRQSFAFYDKARTGDLMARVIADTRQLRRYLTMGLVNLATNLITLAGTAVVLFAWQLYIGLLFLVNLPFVIAGMVAFTRRVGPTHRRTRRANSVLTATIQQCLDGIREVKLYGREEYMIEAFEAWNADYCASVVKANKQGAAWMPLVPTLIAVSGVLVLVVGGHLVASGSATPGVILGAVTYFAQLARPLRMITRFLGMNTSAKAAGARIFGILDATPEITDAPDAEPLPEGGGRVEFREVSFHYEPGNDVLQGISLGIPPGNLVALVGPSGVGKTTLVHLIPRFYDPSRGAVLVDGRDVKTVQLDSLRRHVGIMMQDTFLFDGSIRDNISFGRPDASDADIQAAARVARVADFIASLPEGYDTVVGERGVRLSGGQAQRLALARVVLTNPRVLIMDEPTANVDASTDLEIIAAVRALMRDRTTIVIAHRLWTIRHADEIVLLKDGRIEARGTHDQLWATSPFYREFFETQVHDADAASARPQDFEDDPGGHC